MTSDPPSPMLWRGKREGKSFIDSLPAGNAPLRGYVHLAPLPAGSIQIFSTLGFAVLYSTLVLYGTKHRFMP